MWDELELSSLWWLPVAAVVVGGAFGFLGKSRRHTTAITLWFLAPALFVGVVGLAVATLNAGRATLWEHVAFPLLLSLVTVPPWALLSLLSFFLVRHFQQTSHGLMGSDH